MKETTIIFTDLDGTLLEHMTYSFEAASPALDLVRERGVPLVLCSSKTRVEIENYRERLGNTDPFITENGGGIFIPGGYFPFDAGGEEFEGYSVIVLGTPYPEIRKAFGEIRSSLGINVRGFGEMTPEDIAELSGLSIEEAALAQVRDFGEPFIFEEGETRKEEFLAAIEKKGLHWTRGRFHHILGDNDKGRAVGILSGLFRRRFGPLRTIGLGDGLNDLPMLRAVDVPVLVRKPEGGYEPEIDVPGLVRTSKPGPAGWREAVEELLGR